ncbi:MAG: PBP1A family penicillin-binding protein [Candidatus Aminicenantes bacterium]|nr:PBP1A family penicillin-binding protein [Candidatus Aminicenantes bacterium]NIM81158.1 PBP1A family penicillin-binding protein [Candidatus Aminicenantes bacterium]NIN20532.1 PBP1A family penicillin-binding protein [Candidatus Aminicenantes bacterium]NIN87124.1 PBP1A family penicillin-binding protein [Candidatus Aminicenantes bacterium]NIO83394.1 PBP1A family penicillin-binding protein [Candidatus Aminicenantes bacterium]
MKTKIAAVIKGFLEKHFKIVLLLLSTIITILIGALIGIILVYQKGFPQIERLEDIQPKITTIIHDDRGNPIKEFAIEKRTIIRRQDIPDVLERALIASEDNQFYSHWGINFRGTIRAVLGVILGKNLGGGSSITQQLALNLFLSRERTLTQKFKRKLKEILMAIQIEKRYTKDQILTFYCNKIYLGASVYGVAEAARYYFGKDIKDINLAEAALIPTIMPSPNGRYHVFNNPENCIKKRNYILKRMLELKFITQDQYKKAIAFPLPKKPFELEREEIGNYFVEEVRKRIEAKFGDTQLYTGGLRVYTTLNSDMQIWAEHALKEGLHRLDKRIGWRTKPGLFNLLDSNLDIQTHPLPSWKKLKIQKGDIVEGVVLTANNRHVLVRIDKYTGILDAEDAKWTRRRMRRILKKGDVALVKILDIPEPLAQYLQTQQQDQKENNYYNQETTDNSEKTKKNTPENINVLDKKYQLKLGLEQEPEVQGAILVVDNKTGEIKAMVGGYSFDKSKWNNATQALRQSGSTIKPLVYTAALENGFTPATLIEDEYFSYFDKWTGELWEPRNHGGIDDFLGPLTLRRAFEKSRNVVTARIAEYITPQKIVQYARKFGISSTLKPYMSISLGAFEVKLSEMVAAFTVFPNLGIRVKPFMIKKIMDYHGDVIEENYPDRKQVIDEETAFVMNYLMQGVVKWGTGWRARNLDTPLGGKTGTTNEFTNAWFIGFTPSITVGVWVGFDEPRTLGPEETGSRAAQPIFLTFMEKYLEKYTEPQGFRKPPGVVWVLIDKYTGKLVTPDCLHRFKEAFITGTEPLEYCTEEDHLMITDYYGEDTGEGEDDEDDVGDGRGRGRR